MRLVVDCSNGAASQIAPTLFENLGATVKPFLREPDGININDNCGSQHPGALARVVVAENADLGLAFDGDADRLIAVDEKGVVLSGDQVMAICAKDMQAKGELANPVVVTTVMSNMGLGASIKKNGHRPHPSPGRRPLCHAGDGQGWRCVGGEDSGHMIFLNHHTTGDGMLAALKLMQAMRSSENPLSEPGNGHDRLPAMPDQCGCQIKTGPIDTIDELMQAIGTVENELGDPGRVLVRYSGTQPQVPGDGRRATKRKP
jgi:phosphoglucosamine mutase